MRGSVSPEPSDPYSHNASRAEQFSTTASSSVALVEGAASGQETDDGKGDGDSDDEYEFEDGEALVMLSGLARVERTMTLFARLRGFRKGVDEMTSAVSNLAKQIGESDENDVVIEVLAAETSRRPRLYNESSVDGMVSTG